tara:strand:+ start:7259 stop:7657 length:399 start_codon:yes stop_codon:yes gene_type:complete
MEIEVIHNPEGVDTKEWGPGVWNWLHRLPEAGSHIGKIKSCIDHLCLPCPHCQKHFDDFKNRHPVSVISSRTGAHKWINRLHNEVNETLGKPIFSDEACFEQFCKKSKAAPIHNSIDRGKGVLEMGFKGLRV